MTSPMTDQISSDTERKMRHIWSVILKHPDIQADDNFFDLGGNSLACIGLANAIRQAFGVNLSIRQILSAPTPRQLTALIPEGHLQPDQQPNLLALANGINILCESRSRAEALYKRIFENRIYVRHGIAIRTGMSIFDVGADIGLFSIFAVLEAPNIKLFSFEPTSTTCDMLRYNIADLCDDAVVQRIDPMSEKSLAEVASHLERDASLGLLKIDIQNYEMTVLKSFSEDQWSRVEQAIVELRDHDTCAKDVSCFLSNRGFQRVIQEDNTGHDLGKRIVYALRG